MKFLNRPLTYFALLALVSLPLSYHYRVSEGGTAPAPKRAPASVGTAVMKTGTVKAATPSDENKVAPVLEASPATETAGPTSDPESEILVELREYMKLQAKVLPSDAERQRKLELLENPRYLKGLGELLKDGAEDRLEAVAIASLIEARRFAESETADRVLQDLVADARVEDSSLASSERERLAATKAEVMYLWSAASGDVARKMPSYLPGEVSERLWRNVQTLHEANVVASVGLEDRYTRTGNHLTE